MIKTDNAEEKSFQAKGATRMVQTEHMEENSFQADRSIRDQSESRRIPAGAP